MQLNSFALLGALAFLSLPVSLSAQTSYVTVSGTRLIDANGIGASAQVCAQALDPSGRPVSIHVGGGGTTTTTQVCTNATSGAWSMILPNTLISSPGNAGFNITATDNVSGASLIGPGYTYVQPTSDPNSRWCTTSTAGLTTCNFDNLPPMVKPTVQTVYQGPAGKDGAIGPAGCVIGSTCAAVPLQQPTVDQFSSNVIRLAPYGDMPARANAFYQQAFNAGTDLTVYFTGNAPNSSTTLTVPCASNHEYSLIGENGATLNYVGTSDAVSNCPTTSGVFSKNRYAHFNINLGANARSGFTTRGTGGSFGLVIDDVQVRPALNSYAAVVNSGSIGFDLTGNVVVGHLTHSVADTLTTGVLFSYAAVGSGPNAWTVDHNAFSNNRDWDLDVASGSGQQNLNISYNTFEGGGCKHDPSSGALIPRGGDYGLIRVQFAQQVSIAYNYLEGGVPTSLTAPTCGSQHILIKPTSTDIVDQVDIHDNLSNAYGAVSTVNVQGGSLVHLQHIEGSGAETCTTVIGPGIGSGARIEDAGNVCSAAGAKLAIQSDTSTSSHYVSGGSINGAASFASEQQVGATFPVGACTAWKNSPVYGAGSTYKLDIYGSFWHSSAGAPTVPTGSHFSISSNGSHAIQFGSQTLTFSVPSGGGQLCATPTGNGGDTVGFEGWIRALGTNASGYGDDGFTGQCASPHIPVFTNGVATGCSTTP